MKSLCIKLNNDKIVDYLLDTFLTSSLDSLYVSNYQFKIYNNIIVHYKGNNINSFYAYISEVLTNCIIYFYEDNLLKKLIEFNYFYFDLSEKNIIFDFCKEELVKDFDSLNEKYSSIYNSFYNYLKENKAIVFDGFINFRLYNYMKLLDSVVDDSVNRYLIEREYNEFISILKLYVNSSECKTNNVHLIYTNKESILIDDNKNIISTKDYILKAKYLSDISFSSNDYTLNTLLNILPQKITIHLVDNNKDEFINTLQLIFENRITLCNDCKICNIYKLKNNDFMNKINVKL